MPDTPCGKCTACPCSPTVKKEKESPQRQSPKVDCQCATRRNQPTTAPVQAPLADVITCSRPRPEPLRQAEERCTCRIKPGPVQCECPTPVRPPPPAPVEEEERQLIHQNVVCGQLPQTPNHKRPQYQQQGPAQCGHCRSQKKQKKCVIQ